VKPVILGGRLIEPLPTIEQAARTCGPIGREFAPALSTIGSRGAVAVIYSRELRDSDRADTA